MTRRVSRCTDAAIASAKASDAVLMGSIGGRHIDFAVVSAAAGKETGGRTFKAPQGAEPVCKLKTGIFI